MDLTDVDRFIFFTLLLLKQRLFTHNDKTYSYTTLTNTTVGFRLKSMFGENWFFSVAAISFIDDIIAEKERL